MAGLVDYALKMQEDGTLTLTLKTPAAVGGMEIGFFVSKHFGAEPFISKYMASGYYGVSGIELIQSGEGIMRTRLYASEFSGRCPGNYATQWRRLDSGYLKVISEGFLTKDW